MNYAIRSFQKQLFVLFLYASAFSGVVSDILFQGSKTMISLAYDGMLILLALLSLSFIRGGLRFIYVLILTGIVFNLVFTEASLTSSLNGLREVFIVLSLVAFYSKIFVEGNEAEAEEYVNIVKKYAVTFLILQLPVAGMQFIKYGPTDAVGGTFGENNGGALTQIVICLVFFLFQFKPSFSKQVCLFLALIPLFLNETKISFILIPLMVMFVYFEPKPKNVILAALGGVAFLLIFDRFYTHSALSFDDNLTGIFSEEFLMDYLFADPEVYPDVPRFTKLILGWNLLSQEYHTMFFGIEFGAFRTGTLGATHFAENYQWLLAGTRPYLFFLLMQGGVVLITGFFLLVFHINRYFRNTTKFGVFLFILLMILIFYLDSFRHHNFSAIYFFLVFYANSKLFRQHQAAL